MEWNVYYYNSNHKRIETYNVLKNRERYLSELIASSESKDEFSEKLRLEMMSRYWSRAEWEILLSPWCGGPDGYAEKLDVYSQLQINWERFVDYCWAQGVGGLYII